MKFDILTVSIFALAAVSAYLISGINPAIILSKTIYGKDIRTVGSKNPGFTNFKRNFGMKWAIVVMILDLLKSALPSIVFGFVFAHLWGEWHLGVTFTCLCSMLGHAFPVWYGFKGGKGFLVCLSAMWALDWRVGLIATATMTVLLLVTEYMSLSTTVAMLACPFVIWLIGGSHPEIIFCAASVLFMAWRHKENFVRLSKGTESKFQLYKTKGKKKNK
jgi:glycerol-3-phosphate acyltransferase PlsY